MIEVRLVKPDELDQLRNVAIETYKDTFGSSNTAENMRLYLEEAYAPHRLQEELNEKGALCWLAWEGDTPVGFARLRCSDEVERQLGKNSVELQRLYVLLHHKRKKIGSLLMARVLDEARSAHFDWLWLGVWESNFSAQEFYSSFGFEKFGEHVFMMGDDAQVDLLMKKKL